MVIGKRVYQSNNQTQTQLSNQKRQKKKKKESKYDGKMPTKIREQHKQFQRKKFVCQSLLHLEQEKNHMKNCIQ